MDWRFELLGSGGDGSHLGHTALGFCPRGKLVPLVSFLTRSNYKEGHRSRDRSLCHSKARLPESNLQWHSRLPIQKGSGGCPKDRLEV